MRRRVNLRMSGLGGQGVVTSAHVLATAASKDGKFAISNPFFGAEKRMAPSESYVRMGDEKIYDRGELVYPDVIMIFHPTVITMGKCYTMPFYDGIKKGGLVIINNNKPLPLLEDNLKFLADQEVPIFYVAATPMAVEVAGTELATNMAMLGALMGVTNLVTMDAMEFAIRDRFGKKYVASGGTATLDEAIKKKFARKEQLLEKNMETVRRSYELGAAWAETIKAPMLV